MRRSARKGVLDGATLGRVFAWLRPNDLVSNYWLNNYLLGNDPPAVDILAWNADTTNLPAGLHADFLDICHKNLLATGQLTVSGTPIDLSRVTCDTYVVGARTDHLTPWRSCYRATQLFGGSRRDPPPRSSAAGATRPASLHRVSTSGILRDRTAVNMNELRRREGRVTINPGCGRKRRSSLTRKEPRDVRQRLSSHRSNRR